MSDPKAKAKVVVTKDGPYLVTGNVPLSEQIIRTDVNGGSQSWEQGPAYKEQGSYALCRCGHSKTKPFCDGTHARTGFDGTETASRVAYRQQAQVMDGPSSLTLMDAESLCAFGRFCDPNGQVWSQIDQTDDPEVRATFLRQVGNCPAGRLVAWNKETGEAVEPKFDVSIGLIEDPAQQCSGPIWLRGGIAVESADGYAFELRNRVTLCRCGESKNKPFCDGTHAAIKFRSK